MLSSYSFADKDDAKMQAKLQKEYGYDLTHAPFFLRFAYYKEFDKDWKKTDYPERYAFLADYEISSAAQLAKDKAEAKAEAAQEKERLQEKKDALRKEKDRLKAEKAEEKAEKLEDEERQKEFNTAVNNQQRTLEEMKQQATQGNN